MNMKRNRAVVLLIAVGALCPAVAAAQTSSTTEPPRTVWGDPDLQGVWDYSSITPMQRPREYADREFLTEEEAAALEQKAVERDQAAAEAPVTRSEAGDKAGAASHSFLWGLELGTDVVEDRRTSRIVDPPNGRYPALTATGAAEAETRLGFSDDSPADDYTDRGWGDRCLASRVMRATTPSRTSFEARVRWTGLLRPRVFLDT